VRAEIFHCVVDNLVHVQGPGGLLADDGRLTTLVLLPFMIARLYQETVGREVTEAARQQSHIG